MHELISFIVFKSLCFVFWWFEGILSRCGTLCLISRSLLNFLDRQVNFLIQSNLHWSNYSFLYFLSYFSKDPIMHVWICFVVAYRFLTLMGLYLSLDWAA